MRLWSIHPKYLDRIGLMALWREALLAKKVLLGETKGYTNHPQLERFKNSKDPILAINTYLYYVFEEAQNRDYNFNFDKVGKVNVNLKLEITTGQIKYEFKHLRKKLEQRCPDKLRDLIGKEAHPLFNIVKGHIADWEKISEE